MKKSRKNSRAEAPKPLNVNEPALPETPNLQPVTCNLQLSNGIPPSESDPGISSQTPPSKRRRNGDVARLPKQVRQQINEMLDDGVSYPQVITNLGEQGKNLTTRAVMSWKAGGYNDYLREQRLREQCRLRQEHAFDLLAKGSHINAFQ